LAAKRKPPLLNILFITATRIGDAVLSTGLLGWLTDRHAGARITIACGAPAAPLFSEVPGLQRILVVRKRPASLHWLRLWRDCVGRRWDLVVDLRRSALAWFLRARERRLPPRSRGAIHRVELLGRTLGLDPPPAPRLWTAPRHEAAADRLLPAGGPVLALAPTANWAAKIWPAERFAKLARRLTAPGTPLAGAAVMVTAGRDEEALARPVLDALPAAQRIDLIGLDLLTTAAVFRRCGLFVGNDSGLMHLAAAAGIPTLGLFGPTRDAHYAPWGPRGAVLRTKESVDQLLGAADFDHRAPRNLMDSLTVEAVEQAALALCERCGAAESEREAAGPR
jgi:ADP-heptose:LPS heptosyltransferase